MSDVEGPRRLEPGEFDEAMELVDRAFSNAPGGMERHSPQSFSSERPENHAIVRVDGEVVSHVGCTPQTLVVGDTTVECWGITGVATALDHRGNGHMTDLMAFWLDRMRDAGVPLSDLYGDRVRYNHFGYELAGRECRFPIEERSFEPVAYDAGAVRAVDPGCDADALETIRRLHECEPLRVARGADDYRTILGREDQAVLLHDDGDDPAYVVFGRGDSHRSITEFGGTAQGLRALVSHVFERYPTSPIPTYDGSIGGSGVSVTAPPDHRHGELFAAASTTVTVNPHRMVRVVDLRSALSAFGDVVESRWLDRGPCASGTVALGVAGTDERVRLDYDPDGVAVTATDAEPDVELDRLATTRLLFGCPKRHPAADEDPLLDAVLPLDLYVWGTETV